MQNEPTPTTATQSTGQPTNALALQRRISDIVAEYEEKVAASAQDKRRFQQAMASPAPFTLENIAATFGDYIRNPRANILRGLAEVFSDLDPAFKSHDKVKIGVAGLPKRVILSSCNNWYRGWGADKTRDILNALAAFQRKPMVTQQEIQRLWKDESGLLTEWKDTDHNGKEITFPARGVRLRRFSNGNGHLFFEPDALRDINLALAEYYGEVLADCSEEKPTQQRASTAVSKDLQYYPTPVAVVERVLGRLRIDKGEKVLEPSCGCGRFLDALRKAGADVVGIEVDPGRAAQARAKGHKVLVANFLETVPTGDFDSVVMNPPFYGRHYAKHVEHALKFLKTGGQLTAILPVTARYDHGLLKGRWDDLPVGSFSESGTNINTTVLTMWAPK
jgi:type I restriction-modification system DNA methylase subunit